MLTRTLLTLAKLEATWGSDLPNVCEHVGVLSPRLGKAKVTQLEHGRVAIIQQSVIQLQIPADMLSPMTMITVMDYVVKNIRMLPSL